MLYNSANNTKTGECEVCGLTEVIITVHYGNMWFCESCWTNEQKSDHMSPENQQKRVDAYRESIESKVIETSRVVDNSIQVRTDIFNAETVAINELKHAIAENPVITNKPYALAEAVTERFKHYQQVVFELNEKVIEANTKQKAIQVYLNQLANSLRAEERERLKIADIKYQPSPVKPARVKSIKTTGTTKKSKKFDKAEVNKYAIELGVSAFTLQSFAVARECSLELAVELLRKSIKDAKNQ